MRGTGLTLDNAIQDAISKGKSFYNEIGTSLGKGMAPSDEVDTAIVEGIASMAINAASVGTGKGTSSWSRAPPSPAVGTGKGTAIGKATEWPKGTAVRSARA